MFSTFDKLLEKRGLNSQYDEKLRLPKELKRQIIFYDEYNDEELDETDYDKIEKL